MLEEQNKGMAAGHVSEHPPAFSIGFPAKYNFTRDAGRAREKLVNHEPVMNDLRYKNIYIKTM